MKIICGLILILNSLDTLCQVSYDKTVNNKYNNVFRKLPVQIQKQFIKNEKDKLPKNGLAIFTEYQVDTLNNEKQNAQDLHEIILMDSKTNKPVKSNLKKEKYTVLNCSGTLMNDTLVIQISGLFLDQALLHIVTKNNISTFYYEHYKDDTIFKMKADDSLSNSISISAKTIRFVLRDSLYEVGKEICGFAEISTDDYFKKDVWEENHFYKLQWKMKYFFKCVVQKNDIEVDK